MNPASMASANSGRHFEDRGNACGREHLPLPSLGWNAGCETKRYLYSLTTICCHGQLGDRALFKLVGWVPGQTISLRHNDHSVLVYRDPSGVERIGPKGHLRLPSIVRHQCRIEVGERLLLAVCPDQDLAIIYPIAVVDFALLTYHPEALRLADGDA